MEKIKALLATVIVLSIGVALLIFSRSSAPSVTGKKILMDTYVTITVYAPEKEAKKAIDDAFSAMSGVEKKLSRFNTSSEISKINKNPGKPVKVSPFTYQALKLAKKYNSLSSGYYDITVGRVVSLWDFNKQKVPDPENLKRAVESVKPNELHLYKDNKVQISKGMMLDLGSLLKGEAVDAAQKKLEQAGITKALITTGSSTTLIGEKTNDEKWMVGIQHPRKANEMLGVVEGSNITISTSGDYQQYFYKNGKRYNHIINPKTGYPQDSFMSVTIISPGSAAAADILSTAIFAMGPEKGLAFAKKSNIDYIAVNNKGTVYKSNGARHYIAGQLTY
jgi:thiamine biosynthesis lipoprotein